MKNHTVRQMLRSLKTRPFGNPIVRYITWPDFRVCEGFIEECQRSGSWVMREVGNAEGILLFSYGLDKLNSMVRRFDRREPWGLDWIPENMPWVGSRLTVHPYPPKGSKFNGRLDGWHWW